MLNLKDVILIYQLENLTLQLALLIQDHQDLLGEKELIVLLQN